MVSSTHYTPGQQDRQRERRGRGRDEAPARELPKSLAAEEGLLSCCCLDGAPTVELCLEAGITRESFSEGKIGALYAGVVALHERRHSIDAAILATEMGARGELEMIGGVPYLAEVTSKVQTSLAAPYYIATVRDMAKRRELIRTLETIAAGARVLPEEGVSEDIAQIAMEAEERLLEVTSGVKRGLPEVMPWGELIGKVERPRPTEIVTGMLYSAGKMMLGGGAKSSKTWVLIDLALSVATGKPWWGMRTTQEPVLFVNFELKVESFERRVRAVCKAKGIPLEGAGSPAGFFHVWHLRGRARDFRELRRPLLNKIRRSKTKICILDPIYKCLGERDENSNGEVGDLLNEVESVAVDGECAMVHGHHFAKGDSSEKDKRDIVSGAGAWSRDPDTMLVMRPHEEEDSFTVEFTLRDFAPKQPMVVRWRHPVMEWQPGADPSALKKAGRPKTSDAGDVVTVLGDGQLTHSEWLRACETKYGMSESTFKRRVKEALSEDMVTQIGAIYKRAGGAVR